MSNMWNIQKRTIILETFPYPLWFNTKFIHFVSHKWSHLLLGFHSSLDFFCLGSCFTLQPLVPDWLTDCWSIPAPLRKEGERAREPRARIGHAKQFNYKWEIIFFLPNFHLFCLVFSLFFVIYRQCKILNYCVSGGALLYPHASEWMNWKLKKYGFFNSLLKI